MGIGSLYYSNGDRYVGEHKDGKPNGRGTLIFKNGEKYKGEFKDGLFHGRGTYTFNSGNKYVGEWKDGQRHGRGTYTFNSGNKYVGEWKDGFFHGRGTVIYENGDIYVGEFKDDLFNGQGTYTFNYGDKYVGEWKDGLWHGRGTVIYENGDKYIGVFEEGLSQGQEFITDDSGKHCFGEYIVRLRNYRGSDALNNKDKYVSEGKESQSYGEGVYTWANGKMRFGKSENDEGVCKNDQRLEAINLMKQLDFKKARSIFENLTEGNQNDWSLYLMLGQCNRYLHYYKIAISYYKHAIALKKDEPGLFLELGIAYQKSGLYDDAVEAFLEAIELDEDYELAHNSLAYTQFKFLGKLDYALHNYELGIKAYLNRILKKMNNKRENNIFKTIDIGSYLWLDYAIWSALKLSALADVRKIGFLSAKQAEVEENYEAHGGLYWIDQQDGAMRTYLPNFLNTIRDTFKNEKSIIP